MTAVLPKTRRVVLASMAALSVVLPLALLQVAPPEIASLAVPSPDFARGMGSDTDPFYILGALLAIVIVDALVYVAIGYVGLLLWDGVTDVVSRMRRRGTNGPAS